MKALVLNGEFSPRDGVSPGGSRGQWAKNASTTWRRPTLEIRERPKPSPAYGEVLIKIRRCGVCGTDVHALATDGADYVRFSGPMRLPAILGHEFSGVVEAVGPGVQNLEPGAWVTAESIQWCGRCSPCRRGQFNQCARVELVGLTVDGAFAEYLCLPERLCWSLAPIKAAGFNEADTLTLGALIEPIGCAYNGLFVAGGGFYPGASLCVYGAGPIGLGAVALGRLAGASKVVVVEPSPLRRALAQEFGADIALDLQKDGGMPCAELEAASGGGGFDIQVEAAGAGQGVIDAMQSLAGANGKMIYLGRGETQSQWNLNPLVSGAQRLVGARGHAGAGIFEQVIRLMASRRLNPLSMVSKTYEFDAVFEAIKRAGACIDGKVMVAF